MREPTELEISAAIRREISSRRLDLGKLKLAVMGGKVTLGGDISFVGLEKSTEETAVEIKFFANRLRSIHGVKSLTLEFSNWVQSESGTWEPKTAQDKQASGGATVTGEGIHCPECDAVIRFCPCCGKPLSDTIHAGAAVTAAKSRTITPLLRNLPKRTELLRPASIGKTSGIQPQTGKPKPPDAVSGPSSVSPPEKPLVDPSRAAVSPTTAVPPSDKVLPSASESPKGSVVPGSSVPTPAPSVPASAPSAPVVSASAPSAPVVSAPTPSAPASAPAVVGSAGVTATEDIFAGLDEESDITSLPPAPWPSAAPSSGSAPSSATAAPSWPQSQLQQQPQPGMSETHDPLAFLDSASPDPGISTDGASAGDQSVTDPFSISDQSLALTSAGSPFAGAAPTSTAQVTPRIAPQAASPHSPPHSPSAESSLSAGLAVPADTSLDSGIESFVDNDFADLLATTTPPQPLPTTDTSPFAATPRTAQTSAPVGSQGAHVPISRPGPVSTGGNTAPPSSFASIPSATPAPDPFTDMQLDSLLDETLADTGSDATPAVPTQAGFPAKPVLVTAARPPAASGIPGTTSSGDPFLDEDFADLFPPVKPTTSATAPSPSAHRTPMPVLASAPAGSHSTGSKPSTVSDDTTVPSGFDDDDTPLPPMKPDLHGFPDDDDTPLPPMKPGIQGFPADDDTPLPPMKPGVQGFPADDDTPLPPLRPSSGPAQGKTGKKPAATKPAMSATDDPFASLFEDVAGLVPPAKEPKRGQPKIKTGFEDLDGIDLDLEVLEMFPADSGTPPPPVGKPPAGTAKKPTPVTATPPADDDPLNLAGILNLDDPDAGLSPEQRKKKAAKGDDNDPFSLDDFDISKFKI